MKTLDAYEVGQGVASWVAFLSAGIAFPFTLEFWGIVNATTLPTNYLAITAGVASAILGVTVTFKVLLAWKIHRTYYLRRISSWLFALGNKTLERAYKG